MDIGLAFHLGDTPRATDSKGFEGAMFVGMGLRLPIRISELSPEPNTVTLVIQTSAMETYADWQAHVVKIDDTHLGFLRDDGGGASKETHRLEIPRPLIKEGEPQILSIDVGSRVPGLADDFVLRGVALEGAILTLGWT